MAGPVLGAVAPVSVDPFWVEVLLSPWARILAFVWGTLWGSFANVVIHRVPLGLSVLRPRSRCPGCQTPIAGYDNVPVLSYLILRGRCRCCGEPFSLRYLIVELLAGVLSFALYMKIVHERQPSPHPSRAEIENKSELGKAVRDAPRTVPEFR